MSAGPWICGKDNGEYVINHPLAIGDVVEFEAIDPKGEVSKAILVIENFGPADRYYMGHFVAASDKGYTDWMFKKDGHPVPGL